VNYPGLETNRIKNAYGCLLKIDKQIRGNIVQQRSTTEQLPKQGKLSLVPYNEYPKNSKALSKKPRKLPWMETDQDLCIPQHPLQV
jgi:hypothetical protein